MLDIRVSGAVCTLGKLGAIGLLILLLKYSHLFNLVQVHNKALVHVVKVFDALATENRRMLTTVEMLNSLVMGLTKIRRNLQIKLCVFFFSI